MTRVDLSPNGNTLVWITQNAAAQTVVMFDVSSNKTLRQIQIGSELKVRDVRWADDAIILLTVSVVDTSLDYLKNYRITNRFELFRTFAADVSGGPLRLLLMTDDRAFVGGAKLYAWRTPTPNTVVMSTWDYSSIAQAPVRDTRIVSKRKDSGWIHKIFIVDTRSGKGKPIETGTSFTDGWVVDAAGVPVARSEWDPGHAQYRVLAKSSAGWQEIYNAAESGRLKTYGLTRDGRAIVAIGNADGGSHRKMWALPLDGTPRKILLEDHATDVEYPIVDRYSGAAVGAYLGGDLQEIRWFDQEFEKRQKSVERAFAHRQVEVSGLSESKRRMIAKVASPSQAPVYYLVDFDKHSADIIGEAYPGLVGVSLGEMKFLHYKARDGADIPAYLTLPPGSSGKGLPLVVLPHGGPESRDYLEFNWWVQFLATRGYAVLQPQFRGSTGFGEAHRLAGYRQWGYRMQDDVTDGVRSMIEQGIANAKQVCIVGASYGGYAALAGAAFTPDLYACAISVAGVSDLPAMLGHIKVSTANGSESNQLAYWHEHIGSEFDQKVIDRSPARFAASIKAPILLMQGVDDSVVPIRQSEIMDRALTELQLPHRFVKLAGEDHWLSRGETRTQVLRECESFLAQYLHPAPPATH